MSEFAGTLRERILIEGRDYVRSAAGLRAERWRAVASCRAAIRPDGVGREVEADAISVLPRYQVTVRRRPELQVDQRLRWGSRSLRIRQIVDDPRLPDRLVLRCEEERA